MLFILARQGSWKTREFQDFLKFCFMTVPSDRSFPGSEPFEDGGDPLTAADAERDESRSQPPPLELVESGADEHGAGGAHRIAEGGGSADDADLFMIDPQG